MSDKFITTTELPPLALAEDFGDPETLLNSRDWLQSALEAKGAKITGAGIGCGQADLSIGLDGCKFNVSIRPIVDDRDPIMADQENGA